MLKRVFLLFYLYHVSLIGYGQNCDSPSQRTIIFEDIQEIFQKNKCDNCHHSNTHNIWHYEKYDDLNNSFNCSQPIINYSYPDRSLLIKKLNGSPVSCGLAMPLGGPKISSSDLSVIETWIDTKAPEFCLPDFKDIQNILNTSKCNTCHNMSNNLWHYEDFGSLFSTATQKCNTPITTKFDANKSELYKISIGKSECSNTTYHSPLEYKNVAKIRDWINAGFPFESKILPVTISYFGLDYNNNNSVTLDWSTSSELNTSHFQVMYSNDGYNFQSIGQVNAAGTSSQLLRYNYTHANAAVGYNYYKIRTLDNDGAFTESFIRVVKTKNIDLIFNHYPNPAIPTSPFFVEWYPLTQQEKTSMELQSIDGSLKITFHISNGLNQLDLSSLHKGIYYLTIKDYYDSGVVRKLIVL